MVSVELVLAAITAADLCIKYGKKLIVAFKNSKGANEKVDDRILLMETIFDRSIKQIGFMKRVPHTMDEEHCRIHKKLLKSLQAKLEATTSEIDPLVKPGEENMRRLKFAWVRDIIDEAVEELEKWQRVFDPACALSASTPLAGSTLPSAQRPRELLRSQPAELHVTLSEDGLVWDTASEVKLSSVRVVQRVDLKKKYVVDTIDYSEALDGRARADAEALAKTLHHIEDGTFSLLSCRGIVKRKDPQTGNLGSIDHIFRMPEENNEPGSLRHLLGQRAPASLTHILDITRQFAKALSFVHTCDFVHKDIRPETILVFPGTDKPLGSAYLRNVVMQHDVYGLGVCLLELGLWESFVQYQSGVENTVLYPGLGLPADLDVETDGERIKVKIVELANRELPPKMGDKYARAAVTCLTCLDEGNEDFGEREMTDEDGILVGVRFIEKVMMRLGDIEV